MTRLRIVLVVMMSLLTLSAVIYSFFTHKQNSLQIFPAMVSRDCAPWDGAAFTVQIPLEDGTVIDISIWQSPDFQFPKTFSFPDDSGEVGNAVLIHQVGLPDALYGKVFFSKVAEGQSIEGKFELRAENGRQFDGYFQATWQELAALCG